MRYLKEVWFSFVVLFVAYCLGEQEERIVNTFNGPVKGYLEPEGDVFAFYGVPYAVAPSGPHKFKAPLPSPVWLQTLDANDNTTICPQFTMIRSLQDSVKQKENCLIANIFVPVTNQKKLPVMVHVHGGAFQIGSGNWKQPKHLVRSKKIIAITFNYRLGAHGFLCLGTKDAPGNAGMKDQVALLRWVNKNIAKFGGNPDDVTIAGSSAGSTSVDLLMLSKTAKGLFKKVIPESGSNLAPFAVQIDPVENAKMYARQLGFDNVDDIYALEEFYKSLSYEKLTSDAFMTRKDSTFVFSPCVERYTGEEKFLDDAPINIIKKGKYSKLPMLYGFADKEGLFRVLFGFQEFSKGMNEKFSDYLPVDLHFDNEEEREEVARKIKAFYFGDKAVSAETLLAYINYFTDVLFAYSTLKSTRLQVEAGNDKIYLYEYSFPDDLMLDDSHPDKKSNYGTFDISSLPKVNGANHCGQSNAVYDGFLMTNDESTITEEFKKMKTVIREIWLNFITTGSPVPEGSPLPAWPPAGAACSPHMSLNASLELRGALLPERAAFWDQIYDQHYRVPAPPPTPPPRHSEL